MVQVSSSPSMGLQKVFRGYLVDHTNSQRGYPFVFTQLKPGFFSYILSMEKTTNLFYITNSFDQKAILKTASLFYLSLSFFHVEKS